MPLMLAVLSCSTYSPERHISSIQPEDQVEDTPLTDEEAKALGMTEVGSKEYQAFQQWALDADPQFTVDGYLKKLAEERELSPQEEAAGVAVRTPKFVILINKAVRYKAGGKGAKTGQSMRIFKRIDKPEGGYGYELVQTPWGNMLDVSTGTEQKKKTTSGKIYVATTPEGFYRPQSAYKNYESNTFVGANMDFAVFLVGGIAMHSTTPENYKILGSRASGGCIRLKREQAEYVNNLVLESGRPGKYVLKNESIPASNGKGTVKRMRWRGGNISVFGIYKNNGVLYDEDTVKLWNTVIIVKNIQD